MLNRVHQLHQPTSSHLRSQSAIDASQLHSSVSINNNSNNNLRFSQFNTSDHRTIPQIPSHLQQQQVISSSVSPPLPRSLSGSGITTTIRSPTPIQQVGTKLQSQEQQQQQQTPSTRAFSGVGISVAFVPQQQSLLLPIATPRQNNNTNTQSLPVTKQQQVPSRIQYNNDVHSPPVLLNQTPFMSQRTTTVPNLINHKQPIQDSRVLSTQYSQPTIRSHVRSSTMNAELLSSFVPNNALSDQGSTVISPNLRLSLQQRPQQQIHTLPNSTATTTTMQSIGTITQRIQPAVGYLQQQQPQQLQQFQNQEPLFLSRMSSKSASSANTITQIPGKIIQPTNNSVRVNQQYPAPPPLQQTQLQQQQFPKGSLRYFQQQNQIIAQQQQQQQYQSNQQEKQAVRMFSEQIDSTNKLANQFQSNNNKINDIPRQLRNSQAQSSRQQNGATTFAQSVDSVRSSSGNFKLLSSQQSPLFGQLVSPQTTISSAFGSLEFKPNQLQQSQQQTQLIPNLDSFRQNITPEEFTQLSSQTVHVKSTPQLTTTTTSVPQSDAQTNQRKNIHNLESTLGLTQIARQSLSQFASSNHYFSQPTQNQLSSDSLNHPQSDDHRLNLSPHTNNSNLPSSSNRQIYNSSEQFLTNRDTLLRPATPEESVKRSSPMKPHSAINQKIQEADSIKEVPAISLPVVGPKDQRISPLKLHVLPERMNYQQQQQQLPEYSLSPIQSQRTQKNEVSSLNSNSALPLSPLRSITPRQSHQQQPQLQQYPPIPISPLLPLAPPSNQYNQILFTPSLNGSNIIAHPNHNMIPIQQQKLEQHIVLQNQSFSVPYSHSRSRSPVNIHVNANATGATTPQSTTTVTFASPTKVIAPLQLLHRISTTPPRQSYTPQQVVAATVKLTQGNRESSPIVIKQQLILPQQQSPLKSSSILITPKQQHILQQIPLQTLRIPSRSTSPLIVNDFVNTSRTHHSPSPQHHRIQTHSISPQQPITFQPIAQNSPKLSRSSSSSSPARKNKLDIPPNTSISEQCDLFMQRIAEERANRQSRVYSSSSASPTTNKRIAQVPQQTRHASTSAFLGTRQIHPTAEKIIHSGLPAPLFSNVSPFQSLHAISSTPVSQQAFDDLFHKEQPQQLHQMQSSIPIFRNQSPTATTSQPIGPMRLFSFNNFKPTSIADEDHLIPAVTSLQDANMFAVADILSAAGINTAAIHTLEGIASSSGGDLNSAREHFSQQQYQQKKQHQIPSESTQHQEQQQPQKEINEQQEIIDPCLEESGNNEEIKRAKKSSHKNNNNMIQPQNQLSTYNSSGTSTAFLQLLKDTSPSSVTIEAMEREIEQIEQRISSESPCSPNHLTAFSERRHQRKMGNAISQQILREIQNVLPNLPIEASKQIANRIFSSVLSLINSSQSQSQQQQSNITSDQLQQQCTPPPPFEANESKIVNDNLASSRQNLKQSSTSNNNNIYPQYSASSLSYGSLESGSMTKIQQQSQQQQRQLSPGLIQQNYVYSAEQSTCTSGSQSEANRVTQQPPLISAETASQIAAMVSSLAKMHPTLSPIREIETLESGRPQNSNLRRSIYQQQRNNKSASPDQADLSPFDDRQEIINEIEMFSPQQTTTVQQIPRLNQIPLMSTQSSHQQHQQKRRQQSLSEHFSQSSTVSQRGSTATLINSKQSKLNQHNRIQSQQSGMLSARLKNSIHESAAGTPSSGTTKSMKRLNAGKPDQLLFKKTKSISGSSNSVSSAASPSAQLVRPACEAILMNKGAQKKPATFAAEYLRKQQQSNRKKEEEQYERIKNTLIANKRLSQYSGEMSTFSSAIGAKKI